MTSNLLVAGVEQGLSGQLVGATRTSLYGASSFGESTGSDFARVLAEVRAVRREQARGAAGELPSSAAATEPASDRFLRALSQDEPRAYLMAPLIHRAVDAYRELMNVAV
jgi:hypothetical protein